MSIARQRGAIQAQFTKLNTRLDETEKEQLSPGILESLRGQLDYVERQRVRYFDLQEAIIGDLKDPQQIEKEELTLSQFVELSDALEIRLRTLIRKCKSTSDTPTADIEVVSLVDKMISHHSQSIARLMDSHQQQLSRLSLSSETKKASNVRLPKLEMKKFDGSYTEWPAFYDFFKCAVHDRRDVETAEKFRHLTTSLTGEASSVISHLTESDSNYELAWDLLIKRFHKPKSIIKEYFTRFFSQPELKTADVGKLRKLHSTYEEAIRGAENMGASAKDAWLVHYASQSMDPDTRELWSREPTESDLPTWQEFSDFLSRRCDALEAYSRPKSTPSTFSQSVQKKPTSQNTKPQKQSTFCNANNEICRICNAVVHHAWKCDKFLAKSPAQRLNTLQSLKMCTNCLSPRHTECDRGNCRACHQHHNTLVHDAFVQKVSAEKNEQPAPQPSTSTGKQPTKAPSALTTLNVHTATDTSGNSDRQTFMAKVVQSSVLPTVQVLARGASGKLYRCRALLDACSQVNFASARFVDKLKIPRQQEGVTQVSSINNVTTEITSAADIHISSTDQQFQMAATFLVVPQVVDEMPSDYVELDWHLPEHITLADPQYMIPGRIDLLLGADFDARARRSGRLQDNSPALLETAFGWVVQGAWSKPQESQVSTFLNIATTQDELHQSLTKFWEVEEVGQHETSPLTTEELECEEFFASTTTRDSEGRYIVRLPTHDLPHHAVVKMSSSSTPVRVVFDASCKTTSGLSLNSVLKVGPRTQEDLFNILVRYRQYNCVVKADIEKMFRQVKMHEDDQNLQRIVHRDSPQEPLQTFLLTTVTYGTASAPYLSTRCMQQLVKDDGDRYPHAKEVAIRDFYVDDLLTGAQTIEEAIVLQEELSALFRGGGFPLKKWSSNRSEILENIPPEDRDTQAILEFDSGGSISTLGLRHDPSTDRLSFKIALKEGTTTKRSALSNMSRVYDPLGLLSPVTITAKIFMQKLWKENLEWDTELPDHLRQQWISYQEEILKLSALSIARKFTEFEDVKHLQLYGFCDASQDAYAACVYARTIDHDGNICCQLIAAKTRVAPLASLTIPRLELCGAILLVELLKKVQGALTMEVDDIRVFSDSTVVLHWIGGEPTRWKTFVRNRVVKIQAALPISAWGHVRSEHNPADLASRGVKTEQLLHDNFWFNGPEWILGDVPPPFNQKISAGDIPDGELEEVKVCAHLHTTNPFWNIILRYSTFPRLTRAVAILTRFTQFIVNKYKQPCHVNRGPITATELMTARDNITRVVQAQSFAEDIHSLTRDKKVSKDSRIRNLHPFLDNRGLLRVGGRIERANTTYDHKHPLLLPAKHHFTDLVARHFHLATLHGGPQRLLSAMRMHFWPVHGATVAKRIARECLECFRVNPRGTEQLMSDCEANRVCQSRVFTHTGIDFCGPFYLKPLTRRGASPKVYICVFICLTIRAVHLEMVESLTTDAFIASLKRFTARRGIPSHIYCDNATNFVGASRELEELKRLFLSEQHQNTVINAASERGITFHFIPPASPTFGGSWESCVKLFKTHLRRVAGGAKLTQEQMVTLVAQIEAILNSRPLTALSQDPRDFSALTPGHFLIGAPLTALPEPSLLHLPVDRLGKWQHVQQIVEHFWKRWHKEYLHTLQTRNKWMSANPPVEVNDLVLIKQDNLPPLKWTMGRVVKVHPGDDNLVRVVSLQTPHGITKRALPKICPLPRTSPEDTLKSPISPGQDVTASFTSTGE